MISFSESKDKRIFEKILLTFSNIINSSRELMLSCWIYDEFEYEIFEFIDIEFIDVIFRCKSLESRVEDRDSSSSKRCAYCVRYALKADHWDESSDSCECRDI